MNEQEELEFCGTICMAARRLGIYGAERATDNLFGFEWFDPSTMRRFSVGGLQNKKEALVFACKELAEYLAMTKTTGNL